MKVPAWTYFWVFYSIASGFVPVFTIMALYYNLKSSTVILSALLFLFRIALAIPDFLCLHTYFRIELSISEKNVIGI
jgi:hypothetical protein